MRIEQPPARQLLSGWGPPASSSGLEPLNGVNDPWRFYFNSPPVAGVWVSNPVDVSWEAGATIASFAAPTAGALSIVVATPGTNPSDLTNPGVSHPFGNPGTVVGFGGDPPAMTYGPSDPATAAADGTATAFLVWDFVGEWVDPDTIYTAMNGDVLPAETRTVEDILGADFTIVTPSYEWSEDEVGNVTDFYIDEQKLNLWGPRNSVGWGPFPLVGLDKVLTSPDGTLHRLKVADDGTLSTEPA